MGDQQEPVASAVVELAEALRRRRMVRSFSERDVPKDSLSRILSAARRAPSAGNTDGWDAVVLKGPDQTAEFWNATTTPEWRSRSRRWKGLSRAPVVICVFCSPEAYFDRYSEPDKAGSGLGGLDPDEDADPPADARWPVPFWFVDAGFAVLTMLLTATDCGLGACLLGNFRGEAELRQALGVPEDRRYLGAVLLGEPEGEDPPSSSVSRQRRRVPQLFHMAGWS